MKGKKGLMDKKYLLIKTCVITELTKRAHAIVAETELKKTT
jgi:hypothetical protein